MKSFAILTALLALLASASFSWAAGARSNKPTRTAAHALVFRLPFIGRVRARLNPLQTGDQTATPTVTATSGPQPTPTSTTVYPDPNPILQRMISAYGLLTSAHFVQVTKENDLNVRLLSIKATGDATCKQLAMKGRVTAKVTLQGTEQSQTLDEYYVRVSKDAYTKQVKKNAKWRKVAASQLNNLGVSIDNVLACAQSASSGSSGGTDTFKDLVNLGPVTVRGTAAWHLQFLDISTDSSGNPQTGTYDLLIAKAHYLPLEISFKTSDAQGNTLSQVEDFSKFGEHLSIVRPIKPAKKHK